MNIFRTAPSAATNERFQLDIFVEERTWTGTFDRIEVERSRATEQGPYEPLHADSWLPARLPHGAPRVPPSPPQTGPSVPVAGLSLQLLVDEFFPLTINFTGTNPITFGDAATQIQEQGQGMLNAFVVGAQLIVQTAGPGIKAVLRCTGGDAAPLLGLATCEPDNLAFGRDARIVLKYKRERYSFVDPHGCSQYFYKARFYSTFNRTVSQFSLPFHGTPNTGLDIQVLCRGYVDIVDMTGAPVEGQDVLVYSEFAGQQVGGKVVTGGMRTLRTDRSGHAEILLARGSKVTVGIAGTELARDVCIPTDCAIESLNLLSSVTGSNDLFTVQVPNIKYAVRRAL